MGPLQDTYGELILKKDTILYYSSPDICNKYSTDPLIFLTFHPLEFVENDSGHVTKIILNKDVHLLFMIETDGDRMRPALVKTDEEDDYSVLHNKLSQELFDGWLTLHNTNASIEVVLVNNPDIFSIGISSQLKRDWKLWYYIGNSLFIRTNWGTNYNIYIYDFPVVLNIHRIYADMIDSSIEDGKKRYNSVMIAIIIRNATIKYHDNERSDTALE